jgi:hypothetical protein
MPSNVRKTLTDAGYIAVGLGVMGVQQSQTRVRELRERATQAGDCLSTRARAVTQKVEARSKTVRDQAETRVRESVARTTELRSELGKRVEPVVEKVQSQLGELPERVVQAMEPVAARVRELAGTAA